MLLPDPLRDTFFCIDNMHFLIGDHCPFSGQKASTLAGVLTSMYLSTEMAIIIQRSLWMKNDSERRRKSTYPSYPLGFQFPLGRHPDLLLEKYS